MKTGERDSDRFDRMKRIEWIDIDRIADSRILVVGAGALGNEAVKCSVLAGFRDITVVDTDNIVKSNLSRCVFFREEDAGGPMKCDILAERANELSPDADVKGIVSDVRELKSWDFDLILGCLDNISARLHVNSHAKYYGIPYIDGATDGMSGKVQTVADGPCLQCAMNSTHSKIAELRFSCTGNSHMFVPHTAAEITTTSIIAALQVREAEKIISGREELCVRGITYYNGEKGTLDTVSLDIDPDCPNHTRK
ncbi:MAG: ThiF family adenylyltransferase [Candidatus Methanomethylophilaceae archaeon]|jgi:molybdopterin/thiamine biosynthesis adenylyltransferase